MKYIFEMLENEYWWGGTSDDGRKCPFDKYTVLTRDFTRSCPNQTMPLYISNKGRCIWSENPFKITIAKGKFEIDGEDITLEKFGDTLRDAFIGASNKYFPTRGNELPEEFFKVPQYNTWIHLTYNQNQKDILDYAEKIIENGLNPGIFIIDEGWAKEYGLWEFDEGKFENPKEMVDKLHEMGFIVMLWVVPNVRPDGLNFVKHYFKTFNPESYDKIFLRTSEGKVAISEWWNGFSAILDMTKECDRQFLDKQLTRLIEEYGIDGFKFDGGNVSAYSDTVCINGVPDNASTPTERNIAWNEFGTRYKFHEYKDTYKGGGQRVIQRIKDKIHSWGDEGLIELIPCAILQGLIGHPFICPDMIGGGEWQNKTLLDKIDKELFVRMAQCSALFPMMQFSWAPWEALDEENLKIVTDTAKLHSDFAPTFISLVNDCYKTGEPILRNLEYNFPNSGYEKINDIFMLGDDIIVAPVLEKGQAEKVIPLPEGNWKYSDGTVFAGGREITLKVDITSLPYFVKN